MTMLAEDISAFKAIKLPEDLEIEETKQQFGFADLRRYIEWVKLQSTPPDKDQEMPQSRDVSMFYKDDHYFGLTLV